MKNKGVDKHNIVDFLVVHASMHDFRPKAKEARVGFLGGPSIHRKQDWVVQD
jgi:hypothetical protein